MKQELFNKIFDNEIYPFVQEVKANNSQIDIKDVEQCKQELYNEYMKLNKKYKNQIFGQRDDNVLLDRHKIAACICGAFLRVSIFNKSRLIECIKKEKRGVEVYFYYVNELVAFFAATKFLSFFMVHDRQGQAKAIQMILEEFPKIPPVTKNKRGFWNSVVFNLSQIKDKDQIGLDHYDIYSYAMFFFWLESYFNEKLSV